MVGRPAPFWSYDAQGVGVVHEKPCPVLLDDGDDLVELGDLTLGAEDAVGDDQSAFTGVELLKCSVEGFRIGVAVANEPRPRRLTQAHAVVERCVHVAVDHGDA